MQLYAVEVQRGHLAYTLELNGFSGATIDFRESKMEYRHRAGCD